MFNWLHVLTSKFYFTKPSVQYIRPKTVNIFFKNSLNPHLVVLNIDKFNSVSVEVNQSKEEKDNFFTLDLVALSNNFEKLNMSVAKFETRSEAEKAMHVLKNKLYGVEKSIFKVLLMIVAFIFFFGLVSDFLTLTAQRMASSQQQIPQVNAQGLPQGVDMEALMKKYQEQAQQQTQNPVQPQPMPDEQTSQNPAVQDFMKGLGK